MHYIWSERRDIGSPNGQPSFTNTVKIWWERGKLFKGFMNKTDSQELKIHTATMFPFCWGSGTPVGKLCL